MRAHFHRAVRDTVRVNEHVCEAFINPLWQVRTPHIVVLFVAVLGALARTLVPYLETLRDNPETPFDLSSWCRPPFRASSR